MSTASEPMTMRRVEDMVCHKSEDHQYTEEELKECEDRLVEFAKKLSAEGNVADLRKLIVITRPFYDVIGRAKASKLIRVLMEYCLMINQDNNEKAALDLQSGILYSADEKDFKTAYSYCFEALEGFLIADPPKAVRALKYMCLCKVIQPIRGRDIDAMKCMAEAFTQRSLSKFNKCLKDYNRELLGDQVVAAHSRELRDNMLEKVIQPIRGRDIDAMKCMAEAFTQRSLSKFNKCLKDYNRELLGDQVVAAHSRELRDNMLEKEITRVIEPYSEIDLSHIVRCVGMNQKQIEKAISMMLLDKKFFGVIDQHNGTVRVYQTPHKDKTYQKSVELIRALSKTVDAIYSKAGTLLK
ncbi:PCI domain protein [Teladorsagia circumcincta]|uniref:PCI domain protein n=1 Tax=Teladorsagia circumcincta TaxID=45464 RepID=A0A2G9UB84_TELCI|nr:PCI domain protein [Teladorsagia circumcincta]